MSAKLSTHIDKSLFPEFNSLWCKFKCTGYNVGYSLSLSHPSAPVLNSSPVACIGLKA